MSAKHSKSNLALFVIVVNLLMINVSSSEAYDKEEARRLLEERYKPFFALVEDMVATDDPMKVRVPDYIRSEADLASLLEDIMSKRSAEKLYEDWFIEEEGQLYADATRFYPTIYGPNREVYEAYFKTKQPIGNKYLFYKDENIEHELVIRVHTVEEEGTHGKRTYVFKLDEDNNWKRYKADGYAGSSSPEPERNPWWGIWHEGEEDDIE